MVGIKLFEIRCSIKNNTPQRHGFFVSPFIPFALVLSVSMYLSFSLCLPDCLSGDDGILGSRQPDFMPDWAQPDLLSENSTHAHTPVLSYASARLKNCASLTTQSSLWTSVLHSGVTLVSPIEPSILENVQHSSKPRSDDVKSLQAGVIMLPWQPPCHSSYILNCY